MSARELHDLMGRHPGEWMLALTPPDHAVLKSALRLQAAAEANDGTTPETDAAHRQLWPSTVAFANFARSLELQRNGLAAEVERLRGGAIGSVIAERERQQAVEGWTPEHDDEHGDGSLADAAACYALTSPEMLPRYIRDAEDVAIRGECPIFENVRHKYVVPRLWPKSWHPSWWKPKDRRRDLVRAGALIVAEIERLDRAIDSARTP